MILLKRLGLFTGKFDLIKDYGLLISPQHASSKRGFPMFRKPRDNCRFGMTLNKKISLMRELRNAMTNVLFMYSWMFSLTKFMWHKNLIYSCISSPNVHIKNMILVNNLFFEYLHKVNNIRLKKKNHFSLRNLSIVCHNMNQ